MRKVLAILAIPPAATCRGQFAQALKQSRIDGALPRIQT